MAWRLVALIFLASCATLGQAQGQNGPPSSQNPDAAVDAPGELSRHSSGDVGKRSDQRSGSRDATAGERGPEVVLDPVASAIRVALDLEIHADKLGAIQAWGRLAGEPQANGAERAYAQRRVEALSGAPAPADHGSAGIGPGDPGRFGFLIPLSGRLVEVGDGLLRGAMVALGDGLPEGNSTAQLVVRPGTVALGTTGKAAAELVEQESVVAVAGLADPGALSYLSRVGVPFLSLEDQLPAPEGSTFQLIHGPDARTAELARRGLGAGARTFATLSPDTQGGRHSADLFKAQVARGGGRVVTQVSYMAGTTSFTGAVAELRAAPFDALFIPDSADVLELIAPALAAADLWSAAAAALNSAGSRHPKSPRREILVLSLASGLSPRLVRNAGRYLQGALFAAGYFPDDNEAAGRSFIETYRELYRQDPRATDAYGFDAIHVLRVAVKQGARSRGELLRLLQTNTFAGVTGAIRFGADHMRADPPLVYVLTKEEIRRAPP